ncbi:MAG: hypothetical protein JOY71_29325 [Acetobacteraceae bacterium]|nr:hypothetical protein [Acetobacteraceae bacterium]
MDDMITGKQLQQLVATKIRAPRCPAGLIDRPRLLGLVAHVQVKQLAVIRAGAGFGKTTLAAAWAQRLQQSGNAIAWLALDPEDDEPARFLFYMVHALRRACEGLGEAAIGLISDASLAAPSTIVSALINDLADAPDELFLFLDDYHWITHAQIHEALSFLLKHAPGQFHVIITSRMEVPLPLARLRAANQLLEIDGSILRFDVEETRRFLEQEHLEGLGASEISILRNKTEGWPAVLRIIASTFSQSTGDFAQYVQNLSGALRPLGAYLAEMLGGLPEEMVRFMLRTAILARLCAPLCQAVTRVKASQAILESIDAHQLLLNPLDQEGRWYRYHPLLGEYLRQKLHTELEDEIPWLHRYAYGWYASQEQWTDAVQHAIAAGDTHQALRWIENCAMALVKQGDLLTLLDWQRLFPTELMRGQIKVRLAIAWGMALALRFEDALQLLAEIEPDLNCNNSGESGALKCECQTIRSVIVALKDDSQTALPLAEVCLTQSTDPWTANVASNVVRFGYWKAGDLNRFYGTPWVSWSDDEDRRNVFASVYRLCLHGLVEMQQLRLRAAERCYLDAMALAEQHAGSNSTAAALPASLIARIRYEHGSLDEAEALVVERFPTIFATGMLECALNAYLVLARAAERRMNIERAYALLDKAENLGHVRQWGRLIAAALAERLRFYVAEGRITEATACVDRLEQLTGQYPTPTRCAWSDIQHYAALGRARLAAAQNRRHDTISMLERLHREAKAAHNDYRALSLAAQLAVALLAANQRTEAADAFRSVLAVGSSAGVYQTILDQGPEIRTLLLRFQEGAARTGQCRELLAYAESLLGRSREMHEPTPTAASAIAESLSPRERTIIELIGQGQPNKEIARTLGITPETVKSHVKNIFTKLDVKRRAQAVSRAQVLGLLRTH